jgi:predicted nucleic acid-binding protein
VHVVVAALEVRASFLLTLDKRLAVEVNQTNLRLKALTPGDFIKTVLITHVEYADELGPG